MPSFDIPGRTEPAQVVVHPDGRERIFPLPYSTALAADIALLRQHPLLEETADPAPIAPKEEFKEEFKAPKPSGKEV